MYRGKEYATLVGDHCTVKVWELTSLVTDMRAFKIEHPEFAELENPNGVRIINDEHYALELAAGLAKGLVG